MLLSHLIYDKITLESQKHLYWWCMPDKALLQCHMTKSDPHRTLTWPKEHVHLSYYDITVLCVYCFLVFLVFHYIKISITYNCLTDLMLPKISICSSITTKACLAKTCRRVHTTKLYNIYLFSNVSNKNLGCLLYLNKRGCLAIFVSLLNCVTHIKKKTEKAGSVHCTLKNRFSLSVLVGVFSPCVTHYRQHTGSGHCML